MKFNVMRATYTDLTLWAATVGRYSFVIADDEGEFRATVRYVGNQQSPPLPSGVRPVLEFGHLGTFASFEDARSACEEFLHKAASRPA